MVPVLTYIALGLLVIMAIESWLFVALHSRTRWWMTGEGRYLMKSKTGMALLYTMTLVFQAVHPKIETRLVASVLLFAWIAYTLGELLELQNTARKGDDQAESPKTTE